MGQQPSIPTDLSRSVQVIGAGFSRTGTVSFAMALEKFLKGPVCHSGTSLLMREEAYIKRWIAIQSPSASQEFIEETLKELMAGYVAMTDIPAIQFTEELVKLYPDAVVICQTRDREAWWKSMQGIMKNTGVWWLGIALLPMPTLRYFGVWSKSIRERIHKVYQATDDEMTGPQFLDIHEAYIRRVVPPEKLFFFNVKEGWEPLCKILNCPVPDEPFPRANDANAMQEFFDGVIKQAFVRWMQIFAGSGVAVAMAVWALRT